MDFKESFESSELTTSRVKEHEWFTTAKEFIYTDTQGYDHSAFSVGGGLEPNTCVSPGMAE